MVTQVLLRNGTCQSHGWLQLPAPAQVLKKSFQQRFERAARLRPCTLVVVHVLS